MKNVETHEIAVDEVYNVYFTYHRFITACLIWSVDLVSALSEAFIINKIRLVQLGS